MGKGKKEGKRRGEKEAEGGNGGRGRGHDNASQETVCRKHGEGRRKERDAVMAASKGVGTDLELAALAVPAAPPPRPPLRNSRGHRLRLLLRLVFFLCRETIVLPRRSVAALRLRRGRHGLVVAP